MTVCGIWYIIPAENYGLLQAVVDKRGGINSNIVLMAMTRGMWFAYVDSSLLRGELGMIGTRRYKIPGFPANVSIGESWPPQSPH